jgi:competence protein ComEC
MRSLPGLLLAAFACGVCLLQACAALPPLPLFIVVAGLVLACVAARLRVAWLALAAVFVGAFGYAAWRADIRLAQSLPAQWEGTDIDLVGVVDDLPSVAPRGVRFAFAVEGVSTAHAVVPARISLAWYAQRDDRGESAAPAVRAGERWRLRVRLRRPHGNVNPGGFDLEAWLLQQNLRATGYVVDDSRNERIAPFAGRFMDHVQHARERIRERIAHALAGKPYVGVIVALTIGDQRAIPEAQWTVFNRTGIAHLVSISGLHVTVFATFAGGLAFALARRSARVTSRLPARKIAAAVGVMAAGGYTLLAGAEVPAVRTFAMLAIAACGLWLSRPGTAGIVWLWALAGVLAWDPWAPLTPGFWLSYGAVALLLYASVGRLREAAARDWRARLTRVVHEGAHAQWVVTVGLTPLTLALFGQTSLVSPLANAIAIPAVTLVVVPLALSGIVLPFDFPFELAHAALAPLMHLLEWLAALPDATWQQHAPLPWTVAAGCVGTLWLVAPRAVPLRWLGVLWLAPMLVVRPPPLADGAFRLTLLDVGQGLAAVVETAHHTLVYDTGPGFNDTSDAGGRIVAPFLRAGGIRRIDGLVVSHQDLDHSGGALSLLDAVPVGWFASSLPDDHPIVERAARKAQVVRCLAGQAWAWDGVVFSILHPTAEDYVESRKTNDRSCVVRVQSPYGSALLTGDIEAPSEALLVRTTELRSDVVLVPHHGSRTSSTHGFIRAVGASVALIGAGYRNRFGHPRADIVARYTNEAIAVSRTDLEGALTIVVDARGAMQPDGARAARARYWLDRPQLEAAPLE